jgi:hypothetical protein
MKECTSRSQRRSTGDPLTSSSTPWRRIALPCAVLLLATLAALLVRIAPSAAQGSPPSCASRAARTGVHAHGCTARKHRSSTKGKPRRTHAKHAKQQSPRHTSAARTPAAPAQQPAVCEDASTPVRESEGSYACADGSEPICGDGAQPVPASKGSGPVCPTRTKPLVEFSEASCEDGSAPAGAGGGYACDDGSRPECEDGSQPIRPDDGAALTCRAYGAAGSSPAPPSPSGEESEGADKTLVVNAS